jgi:membrane protein required for colicin V production
MNYFDIVLCAIIAFFAIRSTLRGAIRELFSLLALFVGVIISCRYYAAPAELLTPHVNNPLARIILAFAGIFILVCVIINTAAWLIAKFIKYIHLSPLDRFTGFFVGAAKGYLVVCFLIILLLLLAPPGSKLLRESRVTLQSIPFIEKLSVIFPASIKTPIREKARELTKPALPKVNL